MFDRKHKGSINIFDFDDTLVVTSSKIKVIDEKTREELELTPQEFNEFEEELHHKMDFSDFEDPEILKGGMIIEWVFDILRKTIEKGKSVSIITARSSKDLIYEFLLEYNVDVKKDLIFAVSDPDSEFKGNVAERKKQAIQYLIEKGYDDLRFFDDDEENLKFAKEIQEEIPGIRVRTRLIKEKYIPKF